MKGEGIVVDDLPHAKRREKLDNVTLMTNAYGRTRFL